MRINQCTIKNVTVFQQQEIEFCRGLNVIIGANGTGKSHLLKILYAMTQWMTDEHDKPADAEQAQESIHALFNGLFKPEGGELGLLMRNRTGDAVAEISVTAGTRSRKMEITAQKIHANSLFSMNLAYNPNAKGVFIPPNDVLAIYPGFAASYEKRELAFDQTYYNLCKALSAAPLKTKNVIHARLQPGLEDILHGRVIQKGERFYVQSTSGKRTLEAHLLAEGHRKIAALVHLINNGSIDQDTILFWDEPEANMNPRLIRQIAVLLRELANIGVQVFIATHDYLLTGELSLAAEYRMEPQIPIRFFAMSRTGDSPVHIEQGETLADLQDNAILDEFAAHYQREQEAVIHYISEEVGHDDHRG